MNDGFIFGVVLDDPEINLGVLDVDFWAFKRCDELEGGVLVGIKVHPEGEGFFGHALTAEVDGQGDHFFRINVSLNIYY